MIIVILVVMWGCFEACFRGLKGFVFQKVKTAIIQQFRHKERFSCWLQAPIYVLHLSRIFKNTTCVRVECLIVRSAKIRKHEYYGTFFIIPCCKIFPSTLRILWTWWFGVPVCYIWPLTTSAFGTMSWKQTHNCFHYIVLQSRHVCQYQQCSHQRAKREIEHKLN
jgi:hypothetical protein